MDGESTMSPWLSRFNPTPSFPPHSGPYQVGSVDFEFASSEIRDDSTSPSSDPPKVPTVAFRCFYPCDPPAKPSRPVYWVQSPQKSILSAYARFLGANSIFADVFSYFPRLLYWIQLPVHRDAPLLPPPNENKRWPVMIFSHGLGGSRNSYSHLCSSLASYGIVVIATEHRDGSCPISHVQATQDTDAFTVDYKRLPHKPSQEVYEGRDDQLRIRLWELTKIYQSISKVDSGEKITNIAPDDRHSGRKQPKSNSHVTSMFKDALDVRTPSRMIWSGHSFGAATMVQFLKSVHYAKDGIPSHLFDGSFSPSLKQQITPNSPAILLDLWALPLKSPASKVLSSMPMPCFDPSHETGGATTLAVLSEAFVNWSTNLRNVKIALRDPHASSTTEHTSRAGANIFYPRRSAHLSQSDFGILFPRVTKYMAKADEPERTLKLNARAILQVLRNAAIPVAKTCSKDLEIGGDVQSGQPPQEHDWRILSREPDAVRDWVALNAEDVDDNETAAAETKELRPASAPVNGHAVNGAPVVDALGDNELRGAKPLLTATNRL